MADHCAKNGSDNGHVSPVVTQELVREAYIYINPLIPMDLTRKQFINTDPKDQRRPGMPLLTYTHWS